MFYKNRRSPISLLRHHNPQPCVQLPLDSPDWNSEEHADLVSRDRVKVKEAVRRYLQEKVRDDWVFGWPLEPVPADESSKPSVASAHHHDEKSSADAVDRDDGDDEPAVETDKGYHVDDDDDDGDGDDAQSTYSLVSDIPPHYRALEEWDSDVAVDNEPSPIPKNEHPVSYAHLTREERRALKRRDLRSDMEWNRGLACFEARRIAWTQARTVRLRPSTNVNTASMTCKTESVNPASVAAAAAPPPPSQPPASPQRSSTRLFFFRRRSTSPTSPAAAVAGGSESSPPPAATDESASATEIPAPSSPTAASRSTAGAAAAVDESSLPVETVVPLAPPILPPTNPLRASIVPANYLQLYDKVIANSMQPSCPVNLSDMVASCITGWKRDGEWPPRSAPAEQLGGRTRRYGAGRRAAIAITSNTGNDGGDGATGGVGVDGRRRSITALLGPGGARETGTGKGVRQSISKVLGLSLTVSPFSGDGYH
ncbi:hypothetical protein GMORB2_2033 [Geosmithia morbida]|uniref:Gag1-like clamp domain-containing protein n=1 Tax=Geosmithia morbida TaxID=1094350 RepID=A0A9P5D3B6_9HYPO|nr:uncharacterized protein GMORB2_2033 [Geosmithia morbida]KAF4121625.1 hypothetical protein GMORB2_2033 [Geosmithia morbida]